MRKLESNQLTEEKKSSVPKKSAVPETKRCSEPVLRRDALSLPAIIGIVLLVVAVILTVNFFKV